MKKVTLKNLAAYQLSAEEKKQVMGGKLAEYCTKCIIGWATVSGSCKDIECRSCSNLPMNHPGCEVLWEDPIKWPTPNEAA